MTISFSGLASGLDTSSWVDSLVALKKAKVTTLQNEKSDVEITRAAVNDIKNFFVTFQASLEKLTDAKFSVDSVDLFVQNIANTSDADVFTALASTDAIEGSYKIAVEKLATYTAAYSDYSYTTTYSETTTATYDSTLTSLGVNINGAASIGITVNGVERGLTLSEFETLGSFVTKLNDIGVEASYNEESGIFSVNLDMNDINDIDGIGLVDALNLVKVNEGYQSGTWQTVEQQDDIQIATLSTKLSELGRGQSVSGQVIVRNSSGEESSFSVNNNMTIAGFIGELQNRGLYANLTDDGLLEISGGNIIGGSFDAVGFFGLDENPVSAMVTGDELTTTIVIPNKVELTTRLVEDLSVSKGYFEITNPDGDKYYRKIYSGMTVSDFITELGNLGISASLDAANGILTITGGSFDTLTDSEVVALCNANKITEPDSNDRKGTNLLSLLGLNVEANITVSSTRAMSKSMTYSKTASAEDSDVISNFVSLPNNRQITVHAHTGETLGTINVTNDMTFEDLFSALSQYGIDGDIHDGVVLFTSDEQKYLTGDVMSAMGVQVSYQTTTVITTVGTQQSSLLKKYTQTDVATADNKLSDYIAANGKVLNVKDRDGNLLYSFTATNSTTYADLFNAIAPYGMDGDLNEGIVSFIHNEGGYVDGSLASALGVTTTYSTVKTTTTVGTTSSGAQKIYKVTDLATGDNKISDFITINNNSNKLNVRDRDGNILYTFTADSNTTFADLFNAIAPYGMDGDINEGRVSFTHDDNGYVDGSLATALGIVTTTTTVTTTSTVGLTTTGSQKKFETTDLATGDNKISDFVAANGKVLNVRDRDGNVLYTYTANNNTTFADLFNAIAPYGMDGDINEGRVSFTHDDNGYVDGSLATALGIVTTTTTVTTTSTVGLTTTGSQKKFETTDLATGDNKISDFVAANGKVLNVRDRDGNVLYTYTANNNTTFADLFNAIAPYGMDGDINEGRVSFTHDDNGYVDGSLATALGIVTTTTTVTTTSTVGLTTTGSQKKFETTDLATGDNKISDFVAANGKVLNVRDKDGNVLYTFTANNNTTFADLFNAIAPYGMDGDINEGRVSFTHDDNGYVDGSLATALGIVTTTTTVTTTSTVGLTTTGSQKKFETTDLATGDNKISDFVAANDKVLNVRDKDGNVLYTFTANNNTTFADLFNAIAPYGMDGDINEGRVSFTHDDNGYVDGSLATALGIVTTTTTVTTTSTVGLTTTGSQKKFETVDYATDDNKISDFVAANDKVLNVKDKDGNVLYTFTATSNTTFADLFNAIAPYGMDGDLAQGRVSFTHDDNGYVDGSLATALGVVTTTTTVTTTSTVGVTTSGAQKKYNVEDVATGDNKISDFIEANGKVLNVKDKDGNILYTYTATNNSTFDDLFTKIAAWGMHGDLNDGIVTFTHDDNGYVDGSLATALGVVTTTTTVSTTTTVGSSQHTGTLKYTATCAANEDSKLSEIGLASDTYTYIVNQSSTGGTAVTKTIGKNNTVGELFSALSQYGIQGTINDGVILLQSDTGHYITDPTGEGVVGLAAALGIGTYNYTQTVQGTATGLLNTYGLVTINATDTLVVSVVTTQTVASSGEVTITAVGTITVDVTKTQTVTSTGLVTIAATDTIVVNVTRTINTDSTGWVTIDATDTITVSVVTTQTVASSGSVTVSVSDTVTVNIAQTLTVTNTGTRTITAQDTITVQIVQTHTVSSTTTSVIGAKSTVTCLTTTSGTVRADRDTSIYQAGLAYITGSTNPDFQFVCNVDYSVYVNRGNSVLATLILDSTTTFGQLFDQLDNYGITGVISDGVVSFTSTNGEYLSDYGYSPGGIIDGPRHEVLLEQYGILNMIGATANSGNALIRTITYTYQAAKTSTAAVTYTETISQAATSSVSLYAPTEIIESASVYNSIYREGKEYDLTLTSSTTSQQIQDASIIYVGTAAGLSVLATYTNAGYDTSGKTFILTSNVTVSNLVIGQGYYFKGTFEGQGYSVTYNYTGGDAKQISETTYGAGLFGKTNGATIKDLAIVASMTVASAGTETYVGALGGVLYNTNVDNVTLRGTIKVVDTSTSENNALRVGGLVGNAMRSSINSCSVNEISLRKEAPSASAGKSTTRYGGVAGQSIATNFDDITAVVNTSAVHIVGGIVGEISQSSAGNFVSSITNCMVYCPNTLNASDTAGGIVGLIFNGSDSVNNKRCSITNCVVAGTKLNGSSKNGAIVGQVLNNSNSGTGNQVYISSCYSDDSCSNCNVITSGLYGTNCPGCSIITNNFGMSMTNAEISNKMVEEGWDITKWQAAGGEIQTVNLFSMNSRVFHLLKGATAVYVTIDSTDTYASVIAKLGTVGIEATIEDGKFVITDTNGWTISGGAAQKLGIHSITKDYAISDKTLYVSKYISEQTQIHEISYLGPNNYIAQCFTLQNSKTGTNVTFSVRGEETIADVFGRLGAFDIDASLNTSGKVKLTTRGDWFVTSYCSNYFKLGDATIYTQTSTIIEDTTFAQLGLGNIDSYITTIAVYNNTSDYESYTTYKITTTGLDNVGEFIDRLSAYGIDAYVNDAIGSPDYGKFVIGSNKTSGAFIYGMNSNLMAALKLSGDMYSTTSKTVRYNPNSATLNVQGTVEVLKTYTVDSTQTITITAQDTITVSVSQTHTVSSSTVVTLNNTGVTTVNVTKTYTVTDTRTCAVNTVGYTTVTIKQSIDITAHEVAYVSTAGETTVNILQTITVTATQTTTCNSTGYTTVNIKQTIVVTTKQTTTCDSVGYTTVTILQTLDVAATQVTSVRATGTVTINLTSTHTYTANDTSAQKTETTTSIMNAMTTFKNLGKNMSSTINVTYHGANYSITLSADNTIGDMINALSGYGISSTINSGVLNVQSTVEGYITSINGAAAGIGLSANYTTSTVTVYNGTTTAGARKARTLTYNIDGNTKVGSINNIGTAAGTITGYSNGQEFTVNIDGDTTIDGLIAMLAAHNIEARVTNGSMIFEGTSSGFITGATGSATVLGAKTAYSTSTVTVYAGTTTTGAEEKRTLTFNVDGTTKIGSIKNIGTTAGTVTGYSNGQAFTVNIDENTTIDGFIAMLAAHNIEARIVNGSMIFEGTSSGYITGATGSAATLGAGSAYSTSTVTVFAGTTSTGDKESRTLTFNVDGTTKIGSIKNIGTTAGTVTGYSNGQAFTVNIDSDTTIDGFIAMLAAHNIEARIVNGSMIFEGTSSGYITGATGSAAALGAGSAYSTSTVTVFAGTTSTGDKESRTLTFNVDGTTKIGSIKNIGTTAGTITGYSNGQAFTVNIDENTTIDGLIAMLAAHNIEARIVNGSMIFEGTSSGYITGATGSAAVLGAGSAYSTSTVTVYAGTTSTGAEEKRTLTFNVDGTTKIGSIKNIGTTAGTVTGYSNGQAFTVNIDSDTTIDGFIAMLAAHNIEARITNGSMIFEGTSSGFITGATGSAAALGAAQAYSTSTVTVYAGTTSTGAEEKRTLTFNVDGTTKIGSIKNIGTTAGTVTGYSNGQAFTVNIDSDTTIDGFIAMLAAHNIEARITNGSMIFEGTSSGYITGATGSAAALGAGQAYSTSTVTVYAGTTSTGAEEKRTLSFNIDGNTRIGSIYNIGTTAGTVTGYSNGQAFTVNIDSDTTIDGFIAMLASHNIEARITNGSMIFEGTSSGFITGATGSAAALGAGQAYSTSTVTVVNGTTTDGAYKARTLTFNMDGTTTFGDIGLLAGTAMVQYGGSTYTISMTTANTMDDFMTALAGYGISASITGGVMTLQGTYDGAILSTSGGIYDLGLRAAYSTTTKTTTTGADSTSTYMARTTNPTMLRSTKLADLQDTDGNNLGITTGTYYVYSNGVRNVETITADTTVEDLMSTMSRYGLISEYDTKGAISVSGYNNTYLETSALTGANSNVVERLFNQWDFTKIYDSNHLEIPTAVVEAITRETKLADIAEGTYQAGAVTIVKNGIQTNLMLNADDTVGTFLDELSMFGFESVVNDKGQIIIRNTGDGVLKAYTGADQASNILDIIGANTGDWVLSKSYESDVQNVITTQDIYHNANEETRLSEIASDFAGTLEVFIDGQRNLVQVSANETVGSLLSKFRAMGLEASITGGQVTIQSGFKDLSITSYNDNANATSKLAKEGFALGLTFKDDLGNFIASSNTVQSTNTITEDVTLSVSNDAGLDTKFSLLNITDGTLSIYHDGQRAVFRIGQNNATGENIDTLGKLLNKIQERFSDIDFKTDTDGNLLNGYLTVYSKTGAQVEVGATTDTSNFSSITGIAKNERGLAESARELYCVNNESVVTTEGLFRRGTVTEGVFTVGDAIITIDATTTLQDIVSQINSNRDKSHANAYWDNIKGELVIESLDTGASFVNIEAGTSDAAYLAANLGVKASNFTDIMGYTTSTRTETGGILQNTDGSVYNTRMNTSVQKLGSNAKFTINGTSYTSTSNEIKSDVSRINGVTINLKGVSQGETATLKVERDTETLTNAVQEVVDSYNELMENVDKAISKGGSLATESTLKMIRNQLKNLMTSSVSGSTVFKNLDAIGISVAAATGTNISTSNDAIVSMTLDKSKFIKAFNSDQSALKSLLVGTGDKTGTGILDQLERIVENAVGSTGYFTTADKAYAKQITTLNEKISKATQAAERYKAQLESKFRAMDMLISRMNQQYSSFLN